eukprot:TRINITY_DN13294_c0_g1_i1.p1 TRINITY_DN13294_c0_g1~~TRINITY_DN13294_c0_g1_i1.p1  ORF type:complete len:114 (-),score=15.35 TRINITY_DN13294_c0_g1_i1:168-488(-)
MVVSDEEAVGLLVEFVERNGGSVTGGQLGQLYAEHSGLKHTVGKLKDFCTLYSERLVFVSDRRQGVLKKAELPRPSANSNLEALVAQLRSENARLEALVDARPSLR